MRRKKFLRMGRIISYTSFSLLGLAMLGLLFPVAGTGASAESGDTITADESGSPMRSNNTMKASTYVYSTLAVSLSDSVNLEITPKANGSFASGEAKLKVTTNNTTGYQVYMQTGDNTSTLRPANGMVEGVIGPVDGTMSSTNYQNNLNTWGYAVGEGSVNASSLNYKAVPKQSDPAIITTDKLSAEDNYTLGFATAVGADLPAGKYYNSVLVSVVANPIAVHTLSGITYMQEMSPYVCDYSDVDETKQLIDTRDGKSYWVAKLKDGNCWMTQNLALDLSTEVALTPADSDVVENWTPKTSTETEIPLPNTANNTDMRSWNLGEIISINPTEGQKCSQQDLPNNGEDYPEVSQDGTNSAFTGQKIYEVCAENYKEVSGLEDDYVATENSSIDADGLSYDAHYLIGNYYQFGTATAGTGLGLKATEATNAEGTGLTNATNSICPRGWQLPKSGRNYSATETVFGVGPGESYDIDDSFYHLLKAYGYDNQWTVNDGNGNMPITIGEKRLDYVPMYFVRGGYIRPFTGSLRNAGLTGSVAASTVTATISYRSYYLSFSQTVVHPSVQNDFSFGMSVRCVAR